MAEKASGGGSPAYVAKYLKDCEFPASKEQVMEYATNNNADQNTMEALRDLPSGEFKSLEELMEGFDRPMQPRRP